MVTKRLPKHVSSVMAFTFVLQLALVCLVDVVEIGVRAAIGQWTHFSLKFKKPRSWSTQQSQLRMYSKRGHVSLVSIPRNHTRNLMSPICNDCTQLRRSSTIPYSSYQQSRLITMYHILIHASNFDRLIDTQTTKDSLREILSKIVKLWQMKPDTQLSTNFTREFKTKANSTHPAPTNSSSSLSPRLPLFLCFSCFESSRFSSYSEIIVLRWGSTLRCSSRCGFEA